MFNSSSRHIVTFFNHNFVNCKATLILAIKIYEIKYNISLNDYTHSNNETVKRINVSKIANTSTLSDNSTAAGCNSRLITVLVQHAHDIVSVT